MTTQLLTDGPAPLSLGDVKSALQSRPPRVIILGPEKVGKSTFAAGARSPVFLPISGEEGIDGIDVPSFPVIESYAALMQALRALATEEHEYQTIVVDSASTLEALVTDEALSREGVASPSKLGGGYGRQFDTRIELWRDVMKALDYLRNKGIGCILTGHVIRGQENDPVHGSYSAYKWDLHNNLAAPLVRWADVILFADFKVYVASETGSFGKETKLATGADERVLHTQKRPAHPGGGRGLYGHLPYELDLSWAAFETAVKAAKKGEK